VGVNHVAAVYWGSGVKILYDRFGRASLRLLHSCFVTYAEGTHLGWLRGEAVFDLDGECVGRFDGGHLRDADGMTVARELGPAHDESNSMQNPMDRWSAVDCSALFEARRNEGVSGTNNIGHAS
jgi:hypothetical protein